MRKITLQDIQEQFDEAYEDNWYIFSIGILDKPIDFAIENIEIELVIIAKINLNEIGLELNFRRSGQKEWDQIPNFMANDTEITKWILDNPCITLAYRLDIHNLRLDDFFDDDIIDATNLKIRIETATNTDEADDL